MQYELVIISSRNWLAPGHGPREIEKRKNFLWDTLYSYCDRHDLCTPANPFPQNLRVGVWELFGDLDDQGNRLLTTKNVIEWAAQSGADLAGPEDLPIDAIRNFLVLPLQTREYYTIYEWIKPALNDGRVDFIDEADEEVMRTINGIRNGVIKPPQLAGGEGWRWVSKIEKGPILNCTLLHLKEERSGLSRTKRLSAEEMLARMPDEGEHKELLATNEVFDEMGREMAMILDIAKDKK